MSDSDTSPRSVSRQVITYVIVALVAALVLLGLVRVFIRPVAPAQENPPGHFGEPCVLCHIVTDTADVLDFTD